MKIFFCAFLTFVTLFFTVILFVCAQSNNSTDPEENSECIQKLLEGKLEIREKFSSSRAIKDLRKNSSFDLDPANSLQCTVLTPVLGSEFSLGKDGGLQCIQMAGNVFRILGDYKVIIINCTAPFPLNLDYDGFRPTEAVTMKYWREADSAYDTFPPSSNISMKTTRFGMTIQISSITELHENFQEFLKQPFVENSQFLYSQSNSTAPIVYPRTGKFTVRGIRSSPYEKRKISIYLFLEEPLISDQPSFIRNEYTFNAKQTESKLTVPCRLSHIVPSKQVRLIFKQSNQTSRSNPYDDNNSGNWLDFSDFLLQNVDKLEKDFDIKVALSYKPTAGFILANTKSIYTLLKSSFANEPATNFQCSAITTNGSVSDLSPIFTTKPPGTDPPLLFGMDTIQHLTRDPNNVIVTFDYLLDDGLSAARIECSLSHSIGTAAKEMYSYGWHLRNMQELSFSREFVLPSFVHLSYWVQKGLPHGSDALRIENERGRGVYFCDAGSFYNMMEFKVTSHDRKQYVYLPGKDWETINFSSIVNNRFIYMKMKSPENSDAELSGVEPTTVYTELEYVLCCIVGTSLNKVPTFWFVTWENGTKVKVLKDAEDEEGPFQRSCATLRFSKDIVQVSCWSAVWQSDHWKSAETPLAVVEGLPRLNEENSWNSILFVFLGTLVLLVIFLVAIITSVYFRTRKRVKIRKLTKQEMDMFFHGIPIDPNDPSGNSNDGEYSSTPIYRLSYDRKYEVPRRLIQIDKKRILGSGEFGTVYAGYLLNWRSGKGLRERVAVKTMKFYADTDNRLAFLFEIKILAYLGAHQNVVGLRAACTSSISSGQAWAVLELCENGDLKKYLEKRRRATLALVNRGARMSTYVQCIPTASSLSEYSHESESRINENFDLELDHVKVLTLVDLLQFSIGIANGMRFLTGKKVIHADLAARNILLTDKLEVKISDFGLSSQLIHDSEYVIKNESKLAWKWMSIEALETLKFSIQSDIWAFGIVLWEIFSLGEDPYGSRKCNPEFVQQLNNGLRLPPPLMDTSRGQIYALMLQCWEANPKQRPSFHHIHRRLCHVLQNCPDNSGMVNNDASRTNYVFLQDSDDDDNCDHDNESQNTADDFSIDPLNLASKNHRLV